jgi:hypothetical protein
MKYIYVYSRTLEASNVWSDTVTVRGKINILHIKSRYASVDSGRAHTLV